MNKVSLILSSEEIALITGRRCTSSQACAFALMEIQYCLRLNGSIVVSRAHFEGMMGNVPASKQKPKIEPKDDGFQTGEEVVAWFADKYRLPFIGYLHKWVPINAKA